MHLKIRDRPKRRGRNASENPRSSDARRAAAFYERGRPRGASTQVRRRALEEAVRVSRGVPRAVRGPERRCSVPPFGGRRQRRPHLLKPRDKGARRRRGRGADSPRRRVSTQVRDRLVPLADVFAGLGSRFGGGAPRRASRGRRTQSGRFVAVVASRAVPDRGISFARSVGAGRTPEHLGQILASPDRDERSVPAQVARRGVPRSRRRRERPGRRVGHDGERGAL